jgi:hypothetical protein
MESGTGRPSTARVALDAAGNGWVVWRHFVDDTREVRARRYDAGTNSWGDEQTIAANNIGYGDFPLAVSADGAALLAWLDLQEASPPGIRTILHPAAGSWQAPEVLSTAREPRGLRVAAGERGDVALSWTDDAGSWVRVYSAGVWREPLPVALGLDPSIEVNPGGICLGSDGRVTALWHTSAGLYAVRGSGDAWEPAALLHAEGEGGSSIQAYEGGALAAWGASDGHYSAVYDAETGEWQPAQAAVTPEDERIATSDFAVSPDGKRAVWAFGTGSDSTSDIWVTVYEGGAWTPAKPIDFTFGNTPIVGIDDRGVVSVTFRNYGISYAYTVDGINWQGPLGIEQPVPESEYIYGGVHDFAVARSGLAVAVYTDRQLGDNDLYAQVRRVAEQ